MKRRFKWISRGAIAAALLTGLGVAAVYAPPAQPAGTLTGSSINALIPKLGAERNVSAARAAPLKTNAAHWHFHVVARNRAGQIMWTRDAINTVTRTGVTQILTQTFESQTAPTWYVGEIKTFSSFATADTMASHSGWTEEATGTTDLTNTVRPTLTLGTISNSTDTVSASNSGSLATFNQNSATTINGFYVVDNNTIGGTTGNLYGEATFTAAPVAAGYTLQVTATLQGTAG